MELFAADGHDAGGCERVTGKSGMRPSDFRLLAKKAQVQVDAGRADRESVLGQTQEFMDTYRHLREAVDVLDASRDDLEAKREINRKADRQFVLTLMTRISLGILAAAVALIVALWPQ